MMARAVRGLKARAAGSPLPGPRRGEGQGEGVRADAHTEPAWRAGRWSRSYVQDFPVKLSAEVRVRAPGHRAAITTIEGALGFIERHLPAELARLPRWTFARALFLEAQRTGKSRDLNAAVRQFRQALSNERWLEEDERTKNP
jgi:hypothetical protein